MGWDRHNLLWDGMGWDRKICPMDKPENYPCTMTKKKLLSLFVWLFVNFLQLKYDFVIFPVCYYTLNVSVV